MMAIDPVTLAILKGRLEQIADEMDATLFRSAFNPIIAEAHDASHGIYDALTGDTLVQGKSGLPIFVGVMAFAVKAVIDKAATQGGLNEGDVWIFNDPYVGGTHLSDFRLVKPIFRDGKLFCFLASVGHWHDVGGNVPGNYNPAATECFQEGMLIPPVKLFSKGEFRQDVVDILSANTRLPLSLYGDLNGQINALDLGEKRMQALLDEVGDATLAETLAELKTRAADMMRAQIRELPEGTVSAEDFLDNDGIKDQPLKIALDLTIRDGRMVMDFSRSSAACAGPVNISRATTISACYVALKHVFGDVPANAGVLEPVDFVIDDDSLLSVKAPKPVGGYTETIMRLIDVVFQAIAQLAPEDAMAPAYGTINALSLAGHRADGKRWVMFSFFGGGHGAHAGGDGLNHGNAPISTATIPPLEILESAYPVRFTQWALRPDSGGPGTTRGGLGATYEIELLEQEADVFLFGERGRYAPKGILGGGNAALNSFTYEQTDGDHTPPMASKMLGIHINRGQRLKLETPGGGGYGSPLARDPEAVARDLALGYITAEAAVRDYGVVLAADGTIDLSRTEEMRRQEAAE
ncbi:hydantoinase B/oxoprolinase family protein [Roseibium aestuarii]|uniref:Hydantoinase B/oxoprolinase family protein n=1 Tax=Roseibium aestuarii TaxID=2600299 RepID=A0ABW4K037_9HYPH|nr:hydantoinase B/oxoprolinase family protein [Roseibium aestuarii]